MTKFLYLTDRVNDNPVVVSIDNLKAIRKNFDIMGNEVGTLMCYAHSSSVEVQEKFEDIIEILRDYPDVDIYKGWKRNQ